MQNVPRGFTVATLLSALLLGGFSVATIVAEYLTPKAPAFVQGPARPDGLAEGSLTDWAAAAAPLRGDLLAAVAMARAAPLLDPDSTAASPDAAAARVGALAYARRALALAPHLSGTWLLIAALQDQGQSPPSSAELLKMSYLTAPAELDLMPARLRIAAASAAMADAELRIFVRGDIRLILTRHPDLKPAIENAYRHGAAEGKAYIDEVVRSLDPGFATSLQ
jgi:hypothetical protein